MTTKKSIQTAVRLSEVEHKMLMALVDKLGESASSIIRQLIRAKAKKEGININQDK